MKKLLVLRGNPRKEGATEALANLVVKGAIDAGGTVEDISLPDLDIKSCLGCFECWLNDGTCVIKDDIAKIFAAIDRCDVILFATPLYHFSMSSYVKILLERLLPLVTNRIVEDAYAFSINAPRNTVMHGKPVALLSVAGLYDTKVFGGLVETFKLIAEGHGATFAGKLLRPEAFLLQFPELARQKIAEIETGAINAGRELVTEGIISQTNEDFVSQAIMPNASRMIAYSGIYWEYAKIHGSYGEAQHYAVLHDAKLVLMELARTFDPVAGKDARFDILFEIIDKGDKFLLSVKDGVCTIGTPTDAKPSLTITSDNETLTKSFLKEMSIRAAISSGQMKLTGRTDIFMKLGKYFTAAS